VWEDTSATPTAPTGTQIAQEASRAAVHFSDPTGAQYVVVSPHGTDPDGWLDSRTGYCAYHDNTGDPSLGTVTGPDVPYTNMPYVPDVGAECSSFADPGPLDGADETISHEYAETLTDPYPSSGWTDRVGNEVADKCEFLAGGSPGGSTYVHLATGTFALQGIWANDLEPRGGCETSHSPILSANPGKQRATEGSAVDLPISAADVRGQTVRYSATGLPAGLAINPSTGVVSGVPTARGRSASSVTVADSSATTTISFVWMVKR
jgi:serine protease